MFKSLVVFGALHLTFLVWYLGSLGVINEYPVTLLWMAGLILCIGIQFFYYDNLRLSFGIEIEDILFLIALIIISSIIINFYLEHGNQLDYNDVSVLSFNINCVFYYVAFYMLGRVCLLDAINNRKILLIGFFCLLLCIFLNVNYGEFKIRMDFIDPKKAGLYLILSDIFAVSSIVAICGLYGDRLKVIAAFLSVVALFFLNSRASMYAYIISMSFYFIKSKNSSNKFYVLIFVIGGFVGLVLGGAEAFSANERMAVVLKGISDDGSFVDRVDQLSVGLSHIYNNPIFGDYGGTVRDFGFVGAYIHNVMSYWQQFGAIVFLIFLYLIGNLFILCVKRMASHDVISIELEPLFFLGLFVIILVFFARSYSWYLAWMYIGYSVSMKRKILSN